jgi:hypothetical protein
MTIKLLGEILYENRNQTLEFFNRVGRNNCRKQEKCNQARIQWILLIGFQ